MLLAAQSAHDWWWWLKHLVGVDDASGATYLFWSGFVGDSFLVAGGWAFLRHKNCHVKGCWRLGHPDPAHGHPTCRVHSPHFDAAGKHLIGASRPRPPAQPRKRTVPTTKGAKT